MLDPSSRRTSLPSLTHIDDLFERLRKQDSEWLEATLQARWLDISAKSNGPAAQEPQRNALLEQPKSCDQSPNSRDGALPPIGLYDITVPGLSSSFELSDHVRFIRNFGWASTELGPMSKWPLQLRQIVNMCMSDPRPAAVWWTKNKNMIYNEGYASILGAKHPTVLGSPFTKTWPELIDSFDQHFLRAEETGKASHGDNAFYLVDRNGYQEELWASWAVIPVPAGNGELGFYNPVFETTREIITERRMSTLRLLGQCTSAAQGIQDFWKQAVRSLEPNLHDVPFAAVYAAASSESVLNFSHHQHGEESDFQAARLSHSSPSSPTPSSILTTRSWTLEGMLGLPANCAGLPSRIDSEASGEILTPLFRSAMQSGQITLLSTKNGTFPKALQGAAKSRAFGDDCTAAVLCPVAPTGKDNVLGFIVLGINPRHAYDEEYEQFIQLLSRQMATSIASVVLIKEELKQSRLAAELAAQDRIRLSEQLAVTRQQVEDSETRFRNMADLAPVALFHFDEMGNVLYANDGWFELTQHPRDAFHPMSWYSAILEDDHPVMDEEWAFLSKGEAVDFELRLKRPFVTDEVVDGEQVEGETWIIASAYADKREDGSIKGILGSLTDISRQKWIEMYHSRKTEAAMELKRQQENFMDMTSHEARNPLSAITLCAESILTSFKGLLDAEYPVSLDKAVIETHLESAEIIMSCAQHQKTIIDDVLTLSKLDSGLLAITPIEVQPTNTIKQALKMVDGEITKAKIQLNYNVAASYHALNVDWVRLDPSRLLQILINLLTNAIKFTQTQTTRRITVSLEAHTERPSEFSQGVHYLVNPAAKESTSPRVDDEVYISVIVKDTGRGITPDEMTRLFQRFQQASPKTHIKYGGSGLGLFISRELARMQGGQIGVASEAGKGSTFAFFVRAHRCAPPQPKTLPHVTSSQSATTQRRRSRPNILGIRNELSGRGQVTASSKSSTEQTSEAVERPLSEQHLLIVEDNLVNQKVMSKQLKLAGYNVSVANHGLEALDHIRKSRFCDTTSGLPLDIVLMDVEMPIMGGLACARKLRAMEASGEITGHVPVVAVTANARAEQQSAALAAGMDSVVTKPFRMVELLPELASVRKLGL